MPVLRIQKNSYETASLIYRSHCTSTCCTSPDMEAPCLNVCEIQRHGQPQPVAVGAVWSAAGRSTGRLLAL